MLRQGDAVLTGRTKATADAEPKEPTVKVTPAANWQVAHEGTVAGPGESISVPKSVAERWRTAGLIE